MPMPSARHLLSRPVLRRPVVLATASTLALAGLLGGGLLVASATDSTPDTAVVEATASPDAVSGNDGTTSGGDDNVAVALNTRDGSTVYAVRLKVVITGADTVDSGNAAVAAASCSDCQTVAIALEGVIVTGDAETIAPENIALAINSGCSSCQTLAYAYQNLQTVDGKVRLTGAGRAGIASLRQQLNALRTSGLGILQVKAEVDRIAAAFAAILDTEVVSIAGGGRPGSPSPSPSASASASPAAQDTTAVPQEAPAEVSASPSPSQPAQEPTPAESAQPTSSPSAG